MPSSSWAARAAPEMLLARSPSASMHFAWRLLLADCSSLHATCSTGTHLQGAPATDGGHPAHELGLGWPGPQLLGSSQAGCGGHCGGGHCCCCVGGLAGGRDKGVVGLLTFFPCPIRRSSLLFIRLVNMSSMSCPVAQQPLAARSRCQHAALLPRRAFRGQPVRAAAKGKAVSRRCLTCRAAVDVTSGTFPVSLQHHCDLMYGSLCSAEM